MQVYGSMRACTPRPATAGLVAGSPAASGVLSRSFIVPSGASLVGSCAGRPASGTASWRRAMQRLSASTSGMEPDNLIRAQSRKIPNQADSVLNPSDRADGFLMGTGAVAEATKSSNDLDYLNELLAIQISDGPKNLAFFGTRNMGLTHQKLVEILSYAMVLADNHVYTSGSIGTNAAVIRGALKAGKPDKLTVILPQSLGKQPYESQELLEQVQNVIEMPENDGMSLLEASRICNRKIISNVQQVICYAFHDSRLLLETCQDAKDSKKIVTLFYLD